MQEEFVSEITTVLEESIWRVELQHRPVDDLFYVIYGSKNEFRENREQSLAVEEFRSLFELFKKLDRIIDKKERSSDGSVQPKEL